MGHTLIEKIMLRHRTDEASAGPGRTVAPGDILWIGLDNRTARDFGGANVVKDFRKHYGDAPVADPEKTLFTFDCQVPANTIAYANNQQSCREFARAQGMRVCDVDAGIGSHVVIERGFALPGSTTVGTDSHLNILGAVGAFGQGMGDTEIAFVFKTGKIWFEVPPTIRIRLKGSPKPPATAKDVTLFLVGKMGAAGALGCAVEVEGPWIDGLDLSGRITLSSMATEMGAIALLLPPNEAVTEFMKRVAARPFEPVAPDPDANYVKTLEFDISDLEPMIACPSAPDNVHPVASVAGRPVDSVFIGSCTNGRFEDFQTAARVFADGARVAPGVMAKAVPATKEVFSRMLGSGLLARYFEAGFIVSNQGCGGCAAGQIGMTGKNEVQISTSNRNFKGKQGDGETYLASPLVAAASAVAGKIVVPGGWQE